MVEVFGFVCGQVGGKEGHFEEFVYLGSVFQRQLHAKSRRENLAGGVDAPIGIVYGHSSTSRVETLLFAPLIADDVVDEVGRSGVRWRGEILDSVGHLVDAEKVGLSR